ncbi:MAG: AAA family ATPase [Deltaproteobacteria bacterium]|nr:MAG: AAA family ATPase [Deltaproteobacteria bacterium]
MYTPYYGFYEKPFALSPDPRFLYLSGSHREVLGHLVYGIEQGEGFMAITGEVGTGKTTLCRTLLRRLGPETEVAFLFNPTLTPLELLKAINGEFGLSTFGESRPELTEVLNTFLVEARSEGRRVLLIIDEAQNLSTETLEQLRLLSNLETETSKLLQIVLLGQPELEHKLAAQDLRQLRQRISVWSHLGPMDGDETREYVRHRLNVAGQDRPIFTKGALRQVHLRTGGVPRLINLLCDRALLAGYADQKAQIGHRLVARAAAELRPARRKLRWERIALGLGAAGVLLAVGLLVVVGARAFSAREPKPEAANPPPVSALPPASTVVPARAPAPAPAVLDGVLDALLPLRNPAECRAAALDAALAIWGMPVSGSRSLDPEQLRERLASARLELLPVLPELAALHSAAAPALVSLRDGVSTAHVALLRALPGDYALLDGIVPGATLRITQSDLLRHLDGEVYALWRDYEALPDVLGLGASGAPVRWLQSALAELGFYTAEIQGRFDEATRDAVALFQKDRGLRSDGAVDARTQMSLYQALPRYTTPNLESDPVDLAHAS